jgi:hypothetical protein
MASRALARREWFWGGLILLWAFASLRSARHIPLYAVVAAPVIATEISIAWRSIASRSAPGRIMPILWDAGLELGRSRRLGIGAIATAALGLWVTASTAGIVDFPSSSFPVSAVSQNRNLLDDSHGTRLRILTSDQWGDYLIYRLYPHQRVFFDGRSDFYGASLGSDYKVLLEAGHKWPEIMARYGFDAALLPLNWPLGSILERDPAWQLVYRDQVALLFTRRAAGLKKSGLLAEGKSDE